MSCIQSITGIAKDCSSNMGGIVEAYIISREQIDSFNVVDGKVTGVIAGQQSYRFMRYSFPRNTGNLVSTYNIDLAAGTKYVSSDLTLYFNRMETSKRVEIMALAQGYLTVIVKDANGKYWLLGKEDGASASQAGGETGTNRADSNRYSITIHDESEELPLEVEYSAFEDLIFEN